MSFKNFLLILFNIQKLLVILIPKNETSSLASCIFLNRIDFHGKIKFWFYDDECNKIMLKNGPVFSIMIFPHIPGCHYLLSKCERYFQIQNLYDASYTGLFIFSTQPMSNQRSHSMLCCSLRIVSWHIHTLLHDLLPFQYIATCFDSLRTVILIGVYIYIICRTSHILF